MKKKSKLEVEREREGRTAAFGGGQDAGDALVRADQHVLADVVRAVGERRVRRERHLHSARSYEAKLSCTHGTIG